MPPRAKRALKEIDRNVAPPAKRTASGMKARTVKLIETPIEAQQATAASSAPTESTVPALGRSQTGKNHQGSTEVADLVSSNPDDKEHGDDRSGAAPKSQTTGQTSTEKTSDSLTFDNKSGLPCTLKFVTIPRPPFDFHLEHRNSSTEERQEASKKLKDSDKKLWFKPAADFPDYVWKLSTKAQKWNRKFDLQVQKRDQDRFGLYFYNDFTGYGLLEVIENQVLAWKKEFYKGKPNPFELWAMMESLGYFFHDTELGFLHMIDDSDRVTEIFHLIGLAILSTINILERADLFKKDSAIINIPLVLSLWLGAVGEFQTRAFEDKEWPNAIRGYAAKHDIEIKGLFNIGASDEDFPFLDLPRAKQTFIGKKGGLDKWKFKPAYKEYAEDYGGHFILSRDMLIGGNGFDLFDMTPAERMAASFDEPKTDPLAGHPDLPAEDVDSDDALPPNGHFEDDSENESEDNE